LGDKITTGLFEGGVGPPLEEFPDSYSLQDLLRGDRKRPAPPATEQEAAERNLFNMFSTVLPPFIDGLPTAHDGSVEGAETERESAGGDCLMAFIQGAIGGAMIGGLLAGFATAGPFLRNWKTFVYMGVGLDKRGRNLLINYRAPLGLLPRFSSRYAVMTVPVLATVLGVGNMVRGC